MSSSLAEGPDTTTAVADHPSRSGGGCPVGHLAESFDPFTDPYLADPYSFWSRARAEEPVFYSPSLGYWVVSRYEDVRTVFLDSDTFSASISITPLKELCPRGRR